MEDWPDYLLARAIAPPPPNCQVIWGTTPVVSFGHPLRARVATLGINPSSLEFLGRDDALLAEGDRRLATLRSLGVERYEDLTEAHASQIVSDCATYFERNPYHWFDPLDDILVEALNASYKDGSACHLDLVQWATSPVWKHLSDVVRHRLLTTDEGFLREQLMRENYEVVLVAGRTALSWVEKAGLVRWERVARFEMKPRGDFYVGDTSRPRFLGWSPNVQSQHGARRHIPRIAQLVREHAVPGQTGTRLDRGPYLQRGTHLRSPEELHLMLGTHVRLEE